MGSINYTEKQYYEGIDGVQRSGDEVYGNYQIISLSEIVNNFIVGYVGEDKLIVKANRSDVMFHAQRGIQELNYDTLKSINAKEVEVPASLKMILPQDYVNYVKIAWVDNSGIEHLLYPVRKTSNPIKFVQDNDGDYDLTDNVAGTGILKKTVTGSVSSPNTVILLDGGSTTTDILPGYRVTPTASQTSGSPSEQIAHVVSVDATAGTVTLDKSYTALEASSYASGTTFEFYEETSTTWDNYKSTNPAENNNDDYQDDTYWPNIGQRYGLDPQHAQVNGSFYIDDIKGYINFSSNLSGRTVVLRYVSDGLGIDRYQNNDLEPYQINIHKFAEEAMYKWIAYAILASRTATPEYVVARLKKERYAATRLAKLRLSNIKLEEITQVLKGKSKRIK